MNLEDNKKGYMGGFGGGKEQGETIQLHYNLKNKRILKAPCKSITIV